MKKILVGLYVRKFITVFIATSCLMIIGVSNEIETFARENNKSVKYQVKLYEEYDRLVKKLKHDGSISLSSEIRGICISGSDLIINVNKDFIYIGGTYKEREVINKIVDVGFKYSEVEKVTILVDGEVRDSSEGLSLYRISEIIEP